MNADNEVKLGNTKLGICKTCGSKFQYQSTGRPPLYCSEACKYQSRLNKSGHTHVCETCGKTFSALQKNRQYCSKGCSGIAKIKETHYRNKHVKVCAACGRQFETIIANQLFCSPECVSNHNRRHYICQQCGKPFWRRNAFRMKFCSEECREKARRFETEERRLKRPVIEKAKYHRDCAECGKAFTTVYLKKIYCCSACSHDANLRIKREQWEKEYTPRTFVCKECGNVVTTTCGDMRSEFCCDTCEAVYYRRIDHQTARHKAFCRESKQRREKQIAAGYVEPVSYEKLYERDHGVCQICGMPVPDDKFADNSWGGTIDHRVPLSKGGKHSQSNCQLTHRICNSLKSDTEEGFHIDWAVKALENPYWMKKYLHGLRVVYRTLPHAGV